MRRMRSSRLAFLAFAICLMLLAHVSGAKALSITPESGPKWTSDDNSKVDADRVKTITQYTGNLTLLYKAEVSSTAEEGKYKEAYSTTFTNSSSDPQEATISYVSGTLAISSNMWSPLYLCVKDGAHTPAVYVFDLIAIGWKGTESIELTKFWPETGAISFVGIFGDTAKNVPEPASLLLLGFGLACLSVFGSRLFQ